jgi:hypothetical protein
VPRLAHHAVDPVGAPDHEHVQHAPAADVHDVLVEQVAAQRHRAAPEAEQGEMRRLARFVREGGVETEDLLVGVAARSGQ